MGNENKDVFTALAEMILGLAERIKDLSAQSQDNNPPRLEVLIYEAINTYRPGREVSGVQFFPHAFYLLSTDRPEKEVSDSITQFSRATNINQPGRDDKVKKYIATKLKEAKKKTNDWKVLALYALLHVRSLVARGEPANIRIDMSFENRIQRVAESIYVKGQIESWATHIEKLLNSWGGNFLRSLGVYDTLYANLIQMLPNINDKGRKKVLSRLEGFYRGLGLTYHSLPRVIEDETLRGATTELIKGIAAEVANNFHKLLNGNSSILYVASYIYWVLSSIRKGLENASRAGRRKRGKRKRRLLSELEKLIVLWKLLNNPQIVETKHGNYYVVRNGKITSLSYEEVASVIETRYKNQRRRKKRVGLMPSDLLEDLIYTGTVSLEKKGMLANILQFISKGARGIIKTVGWVSLATALFYISYLAGPYVGPAWDYYVRGEESAVAVGFTFNGREPHAVLVNRPFQFVDGVGVENICVKKEGGGITDVSISPEGNCQGEWSPPATEDDIEVVLNLIPNRPDLWGDIWSVAGVPNYPMGVVPVPHIVGPPYFIMRKVSKPEAVAWLAAFNRESPDEWRTRVFGWLGLDNSPVAWAAEKLAYNVPVWFKRLIVSRVSLDNMGIHVLAPPPEYLVGRPMNGEYGEWPVRLLEDVKFVAIGDTLVYMKFPRGTQFAMPLYKLNESGDRILKFDLDPRRMAPLTTINGTTIWGYYASTWQSPDGVVKSLLTYPLGPPSIYIGEIGKEGTLIPLEPGYPTLEVKTDGVLGSNQPGHEPTPTPYHQSNNPPSDSPNTPSITNPFGEFDFNHKEESDNK